ncbi:MAG TPA: aldose epimerase family protein, partial [Burkholderiales bacterium]|nr:aldose epimerase family protein [Burkholderiales bacterium]
MNKPASIAKAPFGTADGKEVDLYTLSNSNGLVMTVTNYGAIVTALHVPDRNNDMADVVAGHENLDGYLKNTSYFGAIVGRVANRIQNGCFTLDGKAYRLVTNNPPNHLHGGKKGFDKAVWDAQIVSSAQGPAIRLTHISKDGDEGYPGTLRATVTYTLTNQNELQVDMEATTDKTTIVNLAHHGYWNLGGYASGTILDHELTLFADHYTPGSPISDGVTTSVKGTPFDFTIPKRIGKDIQAVGGSPVGYDHNWLVNGEPNTFRPVARLKDTTSGRVMTVHSNQPGIQFYSGNFLDGSTVGKGVTYAQYSALCLETQKVPNSVNSPQRRQDVILQPG